MMRKYLQFLCCFIVFLHLDLAGSANTRIIRNYNLLSDTTSAIELKSFNSELNKNTIRLKWETTQGKDIKGFEIERREEDESNFETITFTPAKNTPNSVRKYAFLDRISGPGTYIYRIKMIDFSGESRYSDEINVEVSAPTKFSLGQNFPNPFNPSTLISFNLAVDSKVRLSVFNVLGQEVSLLLDEDLSAGIHEVTFDASQVTGGLMSGVYFYKIEAKGTDGTAFNSIKKMIFTK